MRKLISDLNLNKAHLIFLCLAVVFIVSGLTCIAVFGFEGLGIAGLVVFLKGEGIFIGVLIGANRFEAKELR